MKYSIDNHLITTFTHINLMEIEGSKHLLETREFMKKHFSILVFEYEYLS